MSTEQVMLPIVPHPRTKPGGKPFDADDKEFHLLERDGGIREYRYLPFPAMYYRATRGAAGKVELDQLVVRSEREADAAKADGWCAEQQPALDAYEQQMRAIAQAAAEAAYVAEKQMTPKAREDYRRRSAASEDHVTE